MSIENPGISTSAILLRLIIVPIYGKQQSFTNVGLYCWNQSNLPSNTITISGNRINFTGASGAQNTTWLGDPVTPVGWSTNVFDKTLTESLLPTVLTTL